MGDFPEQLLDPAPAAITPARAIPELAYFGTYGSRPFPVANTAIFVPFTVDEPVTAYKMSMATGNTASGNLDLGIYDLYGTRLVSSGSFAQAGVSINLADITDTLLNPGYYFMAGVADNLTATYLASATPIVPLSALGVMEMASAFPLPGTATFTRVTGAYLPLITVHLRTTV